MIFMFYIVATPIGNLKDLSQRAVEALSLADFIVCERPNHSLKILSFWGIKRKTLVAFTESNKRFSIPKIIGLLKTGKTAPKHCLRCRTTTDWVFALVDRRSGRERRQGADRREDGT